VICQVQAGCWAPQRRQKRACAESGSEHLGQVRVPAAALGGVAGVPPPGRGEVAGRGGLAGTDGSGWRANGCEVGGAGVKGAGVGANGAIGGAGVVDAGGVCAGVAKAAAPSIGLALGGAGW
jgi:hypothetical protein